jgi:hypothetical protein
MASQAHKDKEKFFAELYALDDLAGEDNEITTTHETARGTRHVSRRSPRSTSRHSPRPVGRSRSRLDSGVKQDQQQECFAEAEQHTSNRGRKDATSRERMPPPSKLITSKADLSATASSSKHPPSSTLRRTQTEDSVTKPAKKAKKNGPEVPQIFAGQTFFFVPNDKRAVPRKRRIDKAILHGASWARGWTSSVTHVIVESDKKMADVVKATGREELPGNTTLVLDTWLTESLSYKEMRDVTARRFEVSEATHAAAAMVEQVRPDSLEDNTRSRGTSEESVVQDSQERPRDALDDLLEEAKATQYLVGHP